MNRRAFFRNLAIGTAALPAVAKVAMEVNPGALTFSKLKALREEIAMRWVKNPAWENASCEVMWACDKKKLSKLIPEHYS